MVGTVRESESNARDLVAREAALLERLHEALLDGRNKVVRHIGANGLIGELDRLVLVRRQWLWKFGHQS